MGGKESVRSGQYVFNGRLLDTFDGAIAAGSLLDVREQVVERGRHLAGRLLQVLEQLVVAARQLTHGQDALDGAGHFARRIDQVLLARRAVDRRRDHFGARDELRRGERALCRCLDDAVLSRLVRARRRHGFRVEHQGGRRVGHGFGQAEQDVLQFAADGVRLAQVAQQGVRRLSHFGRSGQQVLSRLGSSHETKGKKTFDSPSCE